MSEMSLMYMYIILPFLRKNCPRNTMKTSTFFLNSCPRSVDHFVPWKPHQHFLQLLVHHILGASSNPPHCLHGIVQNKGWPTSSSVSSMGQYRLRPHVESPTQGSQGHISTQLTSFLPCKRHKILVLCQFACVRLKVICFRPRTRSRRLA